MEIGNTWRAGLSMEIPKQKPVASGGEEACVGFCFVAVSFTLERDRHRSCSSVEISRTWRETTSDSTKQRTIHFSFYFQNVINVIAPDDLQCEVRSIQHLTTSCFINM